MNAQIFLVLKLLTFILISIFFFLLILDSLSAIFSTSRTASIKHLDSGCYLTTTTEWYALVNDNSPFTFQTFFRHATGSRNSSYPFISGDTFRGMADHIFDETTNINKWTDRTGKIRRGDVVFLQSENKMLRHFFNYTIFHQIRHQFVLVTHNSDHSAPTKEFQWALNDSRILAWFTQNPDYEHKKLFPIPIGVANIRWRHGNVLSIKQAISSYRKAFSNRTTLLYVNFAVGTNRNIRSKALKWALSIVNKTKGKSVSYETYLREIGDSKFVLSPPGNGLDCHRTWEAMLMGAMPIVLRSRLDPLFSNESVLVVDSWNQLTLDYLKSLNLHPIPSQKLLARYWYARLLQAAGRKCLQKFCFPY